MYGKEYMLHCLQRCNLHLLLAASFSEMTLSSGTNIALLLKSILAALAPPGSTLSPTESRTWGIPVD